MNSNDLTDEHIGGTVTVTLTGTLTGLARRQGWTEAQIDPGLPGETIVALRLADSDPLELEATVAEEQLVQPTGEVRDPADIMAEREAQR